jgi:hypothetical protein
MRRARVGFVVLAALGLTAGMVSGAQAKSRERRFCEEDECRYNVMCHTSWGNDTGCNHNGALTCVTYECDDQ